MLHSCAGDAERVLNLFLYAKTPAQLHGRMENVLKGAVEKIASRSASALVACPASWPWPMRPRRRWLAVHERNVLLVVTVQPIHRRGQRRHLLVALAQLVWHGKCVMRICAPLSRRVQVAEAAAADEQLGCRMRQQARRDTLERCGCAAAASSLRAASVVDACGSWPHSQSSTLRVSAKQHSQLSRCFSKHDESDIAALHRLHSCARSAQPAMIWTWSRRLLDTD